MAEPRAKSKYIFTPGRPTKYRAEFCQMLIDHMAEGYSFQAFAGVVHCSIDSLYEWAKVHDDFSEAKRIGTQVARHWWEKMGRMGLMGERVYKNEKDEIIREPFKMNTTVWVFSMKNRFKYHDNIIITPPPKNPDEEELDELSDDDLIEAAKSSS